MELSSQLGDLTAALFAGLGLGQHDKAERRVYVKFLPLSRQDQEAVVDEIARIATTTGNHERELVACSLLEAADRLDPTLIKIDLVETMATSGDFTLRSSAAVLLWQWAQLWTAGSCLGEAHGYPRIVRSRALAGGRWSSSRYEGTSAGARTPLPWAMFRLSSSLCATTPRCAGWPGCPSAAGGGDGEPTAQAAIRPPAPA